MKNFLRTTLTTFAVGLLAMVPPAVASTPDEETPAEEMVCAEETGALKGLCNAFCEAMDCHLDEGVHASPKACARVLDNYHKKSGDVDPPCLGPGCAAMATEKANEFYAECISNPKGCDERACAQKARFVFRDHYKTCVRECQVDCKGEYEFCSQAAQSAYSSCIAAAGDDMGARALCDQEYDEARGSCGTEYKTCSKECTDLNTPYEPPTDECPVP